MRWFVRELHRQLPWPVASLTAAAVAILATLLAGSLALTPSPLSAQSPCTITWIHPGDGSWHLAANWDHGRVPEAVDHVCIPGLSGDGSLVVTYSNSLLVTDVRSIHSQETLRIAAGTLNLTDANQETHLRTLVLSGGTLGGDGSLTISRAFIWGQGRHQGAGTTTVLPDATLTIGGLPRMLLDGRTLVNQGAATWTSGSITLGENVVFHNQGSFAIEMRGLANLAAVSGTTPLFINDGMLAKSGDAVNVFVATTNHGVLDVLDGVLRLNGAGVAYESTSEMAVAQGATLVLGGSVSTSHTHAEGSSITGEGAVTLSGGVLTLAGGYDVGVTDVNGQVAWAMPCVPFGGASKGFRTGDLILRGGSATWDCAVDVESSITISGGTHRFNDGFAVHPRTVVQRAGTVWIEGDLDIAESFTWSAGNHWGPGTTTVLSGGMLTMTASPITKSLRQARVLDNQGEGSWTGGLISINDGAVLRNTGSLLIDAATNLTLLSQFASPPPAVENGGLLVKRGAGEARITPAFTNDGTLEVVEGRLRLDGPFTNFGDSTLTGGTYLLRTDGTLRFSGADIVTNAAKIVMDGPGASISNDAGESGLRNFAVNTASGSLTLQGGQALTAAGPVRNAGLLTVGDASTFTATGAYSQTSGETRLSSGTLQATSTLIEGGVLAGNGTVDGDLVNHGTMSPGESPGLLTVTGDYTQGPTGAFKVEIEGVTQGSLHDFVQINGQAELDGLLDIEVGDFSPAEGDAFVVMAYASAAGTFETILRDAPHRAVRTDYEVDRLVLTFTAMGPPTWPEGSALGAGNVAAESLTLTWTAAEHPAGVEAYRISYQCSASTRFAGGED